MGVGVMRALRWLCVSVGGEVCLFFVFLWVACLVADEEEGVGAKCVGGQYVTFCVAKGMLL